MKNRRCSVDKQLEIDAQVFAGCNFFPCKWRRPVSGPDTSNGDCARKERASNLHQCELLLALPTFAHAHLVIEMLLQKFVSTAFLYLQSTHRRVDISTNRDIDNSTNRNSNQHIINWEAPKHQFANAIKSIDGNQINNVDGNLDWRTPNRERTTNK